MEGLMGLRLAGPHITVAWNRCQGFCQARMNIYSHIQTPPAPTPIQTTKKPEPLCSSHPSRDTPHSKATRNLSPQPEGASLWRAHVRSQPWREKTTAPWEAPHNPNGIWQQKTGSLLLLQPPKKRNEESSTKKTTIKTKQ